MKKTFIILVEMAILYMVLRSPLTHYLFGGVHDTLSDWMLTVAEMPKQETLAEIRRSVDPDTNSFNERQLQYFRGVTSNSGEAIRFHTSYCVNGDKNPFIYGNTLYKLCHALNRNKPRLQS